VFQYPIQALDSRKRVGWLIAEPLRIHKRGAPKALRAKVLELMADVHLETELIDRFPTELSGGQAQRVNIARALALEPSLLVCDEAVSALDVSVQAQIMNLLMEIQVSRSMAMLFISHSLAVVRHLSDRIVVMYAGTVAEQGRGIEISDRPTHPYTQLLISAATGAGGGGAGEDAAMREALPEAGCRFAPRCYAVIDVCTQQEPQLDEQIEGHSSRCWRAEELISAAGGSAESAPES
jgi:oligopeptide/dipeptide ABC transporter ATP-binding protein